MKVLSISTDRNLFEEGSAVQKRSLEYAKRMEELHIIVFTKHSENHKFVKIENMYLYPTNSLTKWFYVMNAERLGSKVINENKFTKRNSVISTQDVFQTGYVGKYLAKKFGFPLQTQIHTDFLDPHFSKDFLNRVRRLIASKVIPYSNSIRVVSEAIKDSLLKKYKNLKAEIDVLPVYVDIEKIIHTVPKRDIKTDFPEFKFIVFMASRFTKEKRFDTALSTIQKVIKEYPYAGLVIAGSGPEKNNIIRMSKSLDIQKNVKLIGWQTDLISYYKTCNVFLLTSEFEGYGMTLIEAGASGAMIVTTKVGIAKTPLFVDEVNSHVCPVGDSECLSNCIIGVIRDNQKRELFAHRIQDSIKTLAMTQDEYYSKYVSLISNLLKK